MSSAAIPPETEVWVAPADNATDMIVGVPPGPYADYRVTADAAPPGQPYLEHRCCGGACNCCCPHAHRAVVPATQPVVPVPVHQEILRKDCIVEVPQTVITDKILPRVFQQHVNYEVPNVNLNLLTKPVTIPKIDFKEKVIEIPVPVGYNYKVLHKWEIREVPRLVPKYIGPPEDYHVEVPQVRIVDKEIEREVPVYVGERLVRKEVLEEEPVESVEFKYVQQEEEVPVYKYKPVLDVQVDIPPPLLVPVLTQPQQTELPPTILSLQEWKRLKRGGCTSVCDKGATCGPSPAQPCRCCGRDCAGECLCASCQPGAACSGGGTCGQALRCECCCGRTVEGGCSCNCGA